MRYFVLAGNYSQFLSFCQENDLNPADRFLVIYVNDEWSVQGCAPQEGDEVVHVGTWSENRNLRGVDSLMSARGWEI